MDLEPLRGEASEAYWETVSDSEHNFLPPVKGSHSGIHFFSRPNAQYCMGLLLAFVLGAICTFVLIAEQRRPEVYHHGLHSTTDTVACTSWIVSNCWQVTNRTLQFSEGIVVLGW